MSAPIGGTVIQRRVGLGQYINAGATDPVFTVGNLSTVWLIANVRESDAPKMKIGAPVEVSVLAYPGRTFNAKLSYVAPALDPNTRRLPVRAEIENPGRELLPEMFASFRIVSGDNRLMPAVPQEAVVYEGAQARVWVARPDQKAVVTRPIEVGATTNGLVEVRKGLAVGETVVASGTLFIDRAATPRLTRSAVGRTSVMHAIVAAALKQRILVIILAAALMVGGLFAYKQLNIEAYPDPVPPLVDIITQNPGQSSEEIERYITIPIEVQMAGLPYVTVGPHHLAVRPLRREGAVHLRRHLRAGLAAGASTGCRSSPPLPNGAQPHAVADQPDRRDLPLPRGRPARLHASPTSRPSRTGCCSAASRRCPA